MAAVPCYSGRGTLFLTLEFHSSQLTPSQTADVSRVASVISCKLCSQISPQGRAATIATSYTLKMAFKFGANNFNFIRIRLGQVRLGYVMLC